MITVKLSAITHVVEFDRQTDLHMGASIIKVTGNNSSMDRLRTTIFADNNQNWLRLTDDDYTSVNVYRLGDENNPHYGSNQ